MNCDNVTDVTNPANICFSNILNRIYFHTAKMKLSFSFVTFSAIFFKLIWIFLTILVTDITQACWIGFFYFPFIWIDLRFNFLFWGNLTSMVVTFWCTMFFVIKNLITTSLLFLKEMVSFLSPFLYNKYGASWLCQNQIKFFKILFQCIYQKIFFLNDSHWMREQNPTNVHNLQ